MSQVLRDLDLEAGLLVRRQVRGLLEELKFRGHVADYREIRGLLESKFIMRAADNHAIGILNRWCLTVNATA